MEKEPALKYIPQRQPMVMVDNLVYSDEVVTATDFLVREDCIFVEQGRLTEVGLLENIAQTCATRIGYLNRNQTVKIGVIGGIKDFEVFDCVYVDDILNTKITVCSSVYTATMVDAEIVCNEKMIAKCNMKVFVMEGEKN
ncbi:MAG: pseudouridylate synthase [Bacteroidales bacterium]|jgi:predicted hotdog family 3-hydroxylacyl-ACP dehydratase|nr:pseudouridylate synthase [Bacteroidales bacterium]MDD2204154.1 pseudouridylate synthase [Bacteroidales bacterium]MDD3151800.1 pseudouridylate synthase [Bacteroidales bacterium]MDD3914725.1 pseudouridylate synthase [Bacteroidales bacterium]MDD4633583.1 pseudouridylate synthase [Bacteroidales bacterium]